MKKTILLVDDEPDILKVVTFMLKQAGYKVFGALDAPKALKLVRQKMPDLIILDVYLPGMKGDEVTAILKKDKKTKSIPVILISADQTTLEARFKKCGADGYLGKPFETPDMLSMIKKYISGQEHAKKKRCSAGKQALRGSAKSRRPWV